MSVEEEDFRSIITFGTRNFDMVKDLRDTLQFSNYIIKCPNEQNTQWLTGLDSKYYDVEQFHKFISQQNDRLSLIHFNTVNLAKKHESLGELLSPIISKLHCIAVTETKLKNDTNNDENKNPQ